MEQPVNEATPEEAPSGLESQPSDAPPVPLPAAMASPIDELEVVTVLPPASATVTDGCAAHTTPAGAPPGWLLNRRRAGGPTVIAKGSLTASLSPLECAARVYEPPVLSMLQPSNCAEPWTAGSEVAVHVSAPGPLPEVIAS